MTRPEYSQSARIIFTERMAIVMTCLNSVRTFQVQTWRAKIYGGVMLTGSKESCSMSADKYILNLLF